eukprot:5569859-Amphidinium_carterae.1
MAQGAIAIALLSHVVRGSQVPHSAPPCWYSYEDLVIVPGLFWNVLKVEQQHDAVYASVHLTHTQSQGVVA